MKKILKKILIIFIVFLLVFEYCCSSPVFASSESDIPPEVLNAITNLAGGIVSIILWIPRLLAMAFSFIINQATQWVAEFGDNPTPDKNTSIFMTPYDIFFSTSNSLEGSNENNNYEILSVNFFKTESGTSFVRNIRKAVSQWFYITRFIASAILLCILIYVGIRMALSSVAEDRAKYKKMLVDWICSLLLVFLLHYIAIAVIYANEAIVLALRGFVAGINNDNFNRFMNKLAMQALIGVGIDSIVSVFVFCGIVAQTIFFLIAYLNRMLKVGFLIIISPLISITYSIDKMGDGKAQALNRWLKEFIYTVLIQPFHCIMYLALIQTAMTILTESFNGIDNVVKVNQLASGVLVILCLKFINDAEQIVRKIFGFADDNSKTSMAAGTIAAVALLQNAPKIGSSARKGISVAKNGVQKFTKAIGTDSSKIGKFLGNTKLGESNKNLLNKFDESKVGKGLSKVGEGIGNRISKVSEGVNNLIDGIKRKLKDSAKTGNYSEKKSKSSEKGKLRKAIDFSRKQLTKNSVSRALGMMGMAMAYATGNTGLLEAGATGRAFSEGAQEFFNSSLNGQAKQQDENVRIVEERDGKEIKENLEEAEEKLRQAGKECISADEATSQKEAAQEKANTATQKAQNYERELEKANQDVTDAEGRLATARTNGSSSDDILRLQNDLNDKKAIAKQFQENYDRAKTEEESAVDELNSWTEIENAARKRDEFARKREIFLSEEEMRKRMARRANGPSDATLQKKKNEILQLIMKIKMIQSNGGEHDSSHQNILTEDEKDRAVRTRDKMIQLVESGVLKGGASEDMVDKIMQQSGLKSRSTSTGDGVHKATEDAQGVQDSMADATVKLRQAMKDYEYLCREKSIAKSFDSTTAVGIEESDYVDTLCRRYRRNIASNG